jgi:hypothetical protein
MKTEHPDVEYHVAEGGDFAKVTHDPDEASAMVVTLCVSRGRAILDVCIWTEAGARHYGGDDAVTRYREDPDASVFERFEFKCNMVGRVP